jgi:DHA2 family multidrug resistance protein-like MFS transporter
LTSTTTPRHHTPVAAPGAGRRRWFGLAVLFLPTLLVAIDNTVLGFALPAISAALAPSATQALWVVDVYPLVLAALLVTMGTVGDRIGHRRTLLVGVAGFGAVSLAAAFATDAVHLVAARALLGLFGAMLMPATLALLRSLFRDRARRRLALAIWATGFAAGAALGPILGGLLLQHFWWGAVFLVNVPVMLVLLVLAPVALPESRRPAPGRIDPLGVLLSLVAMGPAVLAVKTAAHDGLTGTAVLAALVAGAAGALFVRRARARRSAGEEPLLDVSLLASPVLRLSALANATTMFALTGLLFFSAQFLVLVAGLEPMAAGYVLLPGFVVTMLAGLAAARLGRILPLRLLVPAGLLTAAAGFVLTTVLGAGPAVALLAAANVLVGAGIGLSETITNDAILAAAPPERAGSAAALSETAYEIGAVLGTAVLGSVLSAVYRSAVVVPSGVGGADAVAATETVGGAVGVAGRLAGPDAATLLASARAAFVTGIGAASVVGAAVLVLVALAVAIGLRATRPVAAEGSTAAQDADQVDGLPGQRTQHR